MERSPAPTPPATATPLGPTASPPLVPGAPDPERLPRPLTALLGLTIVWVSTVVVVAVRGGFVAAGLPVATVIALSVPVGGAVVAYRAVHSFRVWVDGVDVATVVAVQAWRVMGIAFLFGWVAGQLPAAFAIPAAVGDLAVGLAAVPATLAAARGHLSRRMLLGLTALGFADFIVAIVLGATLQPQALETVPWVLFPVLAVPSFAIFHLWALAAVGPRVHDDHRAHGSIRAGVATSVH